MADHSQQQQQQQGASATNSPFKTPSKDFFKGMTAAIDRSFDKLQQFPATASQSLDKLTPTAGPTTSTTTTATTTTGATSTTSTTASSTIGGGVSSSTGDGGQLSYQEFARVTQEHIQLKNELYDTTQREKKLRAEHEQLKKNFQIMEKDLAKATDIVKKSSSKTEFIHLSQENSNLHKEIEQRDEQLRALRENMKEMYAAQELLEKQVAEHGKAGRDHAVQSEQYENLLKMNNSLELELASAKAESKLFTERVTAQLSSMREMLQQGDTDEHKVVALGKILDDTQTNLQSHRPSAETSSDSISVDSLNNQLRNWQLQVEHKQQEVVSLKAEYEDKLAQMKRRYDEELVFKEMELANLRSSGVSRHDDKNYKALYEDLVNKEKSTHKSFGELNDRFAQLMEEKHALQTAHQKLETEFQKQASLSQKLTSMDDEIHSRDNLIKSLQEQLNHSQDQQEQLSKKISSLKEEKAELSDRFGQTMDQLSKEKEIAENRKQLSDTLSREKQELAVAHRDQLATLQQQTAALESDKQSLQHDIETKDQTIAKLQTELDAKEVELKSLTEQISQINQQLEALHADKTVLEQQKLELEENVKHLTQDAEHHTTELQGAEKRHAQMTKDLKKQLAQERKTREALEHRITSAGGTIMPSTGEDIQELVAKVTELQQDHYQYKEKIKILEEDIKILQLDNEAKSKVIQELLPTGNSKLFSEEREAQLTPGKLADMIKRKATLQSSSPSDENARKLQNVLEETLLKNKYLQETILALRAELSARAESSPSRADLSSKSREL